MARGWESKSVEDQQATREQNRPAGEPVTPEEAARHAQRQMLDLTRARTLADLAVARSPAHRAMLEAALRALDDQLRRYGTQTA
jgi:hypothetical protein